jgi:hypothetical protein
MTYLIRGMPIRYATFDRIQKAQGIANQKNVVVSNKKRDTTVDLILADKALKKYPVFRG